MQLLLCLSLFRNAIVLPLIPLILFFAPKIEKSPNYTLGQAVVCFSQLNFKLVGFQ